jgi:cell division protein FtsI (penicillin-binding protein 3)
MSRVAARRAGSLAILLLFCFAALGLRLGYVQGVRSDQYSAEARKQRVRKIELPARRGAIYDRYGGELAVSIPARTVYANPRQVRDPSRTASALAPLLGRPVAAVDADLRSKRAFVYLGRRIGVVSAKKIAKLGLPGIGVVDEPRRLYPGATLGAGVLGFIGTDQRGLAGLEYGYEELLGGKPGYRVLEQDPMGRRIPQGMFTEVSPVPGSDLVLTIDPDLQLASEDALGRAIERTHANSGMLVAVDPRSGEILAMANMPSYDPNILGSVDAALTKNRIVSDAFEPGSVNKVVEAAAVLSEGIMKPSDHIFVPGQMAFGSKVFKEERATGSLDLRTILAKSSNLGAIRLAQQLGPQRLDAWLQRFGYGRGTGLGFPGESAGSVPPAGRNATALPTMAIGQGLSVTTLQLAEVYATIANNGIATEPRLVSGWIDPVGELHRPAEPRSRRVVPTTVAKQLRDMLQSVVTDGTAPAAAIPGYAVAGKTGTAQRPVAGGYSGYTASFVGMFPASAPRLVMAVILDNPVPPEGGLASAPVFSEVGKQAVRLLRIPPGR